MKTLTQRQKDALARHKKKGTHTRKHMEEMKKLMLKKLKQIVGMVPFHLKTQYWISFIILLQ